MEGLLNALPLLACPIGMGLMFWLMSRGNRNEQSGSVPMEGGNTPASRTTVETSPDDRLAQLHAQLGEVQAQQAAIAVQIARLSAEDSAERPADGAGTKPGGPASPPTPRAGRVGQGPRRQTGPGTHEPETDHGRLPT